MKSYRSKLRFDPLFLAFVIFLAFATQAQDKSSKSGLNTIEFNTSKGLITCHLPGNLYKGDVISGTIISEPMGKNENQRSKNLKDLSDYSLLIGDANYNVSENISSFIIPEDLQNEYLNISVVDAKGKHAGSSEIPITSGARYSDFPNRTLDVTIPPIIEQNSVTKLLGTFDGHSHNTSVLIGGNEANILAESPREIFIEQTAGEPGMQDITIVDGDLRYEQEVRLINVQLWASALNLKRGESTDIHVEVYGLEELADKLHVEVNNHTPGILDLKGGNHQTIDIDPVDIPKDGRWATTVTGNSLMTGNFTVDIDIPLPPATHIVPVFPVQVMIDEVPFDFVWEPVNLPQNSNYTLKLWRMPGSGPDTQVDISEVSPIFSKANIVGNSLNYPADFDGQDLEDKGKYLWMVETIGSTGIQTSGPVVYFRLVFGPLPPEDHPPGPGDPCEDPEYVKKEEAACADIIRYEFEVPLNDVNETFNTFKYDWQEYFRMLTQTMTQFDLELSMIKYWVGVGEEIDKRAQQVQKVAGLVKKGIGKGVKAYKEGGEEVMKEMSKEFAEDKVKEFEQSAVNSVSKTAGALYDLEDLAIRRIGLGIAKGITGVYPDKMADAFRRQLQISTTRLMEWVDNRYNRGAIPQHPTLQDGIEDMCRMLNQLDQIERNFEKAVEEAGFICIECEIPMDLLEDMARLRNDIETHIRMFGDSIDQIRQRLMEALAIIRNKDAYEDVSRLGSAQGNIKKWTEEINRVMDDSKSQLQRALDTRK